jgi:hypothetical protein
LRCLFDPLPMPCAQDLLWARSRGDCLQAELNNGIGRLKLDRREIAVDRSDVLRSTLTSRSKHMRRPRISIASVLVVIGIVGVALAAHRNPSHLWANGLYTLAFGTLLVAAVNVVYGWAERRAYWMGFLICGGAYFVVCSVPGLRDSVGPRLVTVAILDLLYPHNSTPTAQQWTSSVAGYVSAPGLIVNSNAGMIIDSSPVALTPFWTTTSSVPPPIPQNAWLAWTAPDHSYGVGYQIGSVSLVSSDSYRQIGHSLFTVLAGTFGSIYARGRYRARAASEVAKQSGGDATV